MKLKELHRDDVFNLIQEIGKLVKQDVSLYRFVEATQRWIRITLGTIDEYADPYLRTAPRYGYFIVAASREPELVTGNVTRAYITMFNIAPFPGSCALCVSTGTAVCENLRNRGINRIGIRLRQALAGAAGYTGMIATDRTRNTFTTQTLLGAGFTCISQMKNRRTANEISVFLKELE